MKWLVGIDLRDANAGAAAWARWLKGQASGEVFVGIHVFEPVPGVVLDDAGTRPQDRARELVAEALEPFETTGVFAEVSVGVGAPPSDQLARERDSRGCDGVVVGRRAPARADRLIRLGRVARRLVSQLPCPVVVVPPDFTPADIPDGPVMVAIDMSDSCKSAVRWAVEFGAVAGREVKLAHVAHMPELGFMMPPDVQEELEKGANKHDKAEFDNWAAEAGFGDLEHLYLQGSVAPALLSGAQEHNACILVAGSRKLSGLQRVFISPVGSDLAANAARPVALVPPTD